MTFSVAIIFFLQGIALPTRLLLNGYRPLRLHGFVLGWNFLLFPAVTVLIVLPLSRGLTTELLLGFGLLSLLPTTIASATAYTAISGGAVPNAIFATVLSNVLAVVVVPLVSVLYFRWGLSVEIPLGRVLLGLMYTLILPLFLGQVVQWFAVLTVDQAGKFTRQVSAGIILFIVYLVFARSINAGTFDLLSAGSLVFTVFVVLLLLAGSTALAWKSASWLNLTVPQKIAAFYCAGQKSLAAGLPLVSSILLAVSDIGEVGIVLIPMLCFHPLQMLLAGIVSPQLKQKNPCSECLRIRLEKVCSF